MWAESEAPFGFFDIFLQIQEKKHSQILKIEKNWGWAKKFARNDCTQYFQLILNRFFFEIIFGYFEIVFRRPDSKVFSEIIGIWHSKLIYCKLDMFGMFGDSDSHRMVESNHENIQLFDACKFAKELWRFLFVFSSIRKKNDRKSKFFVEWIVE